MSWREGTKGKLAAKFTWVRVWPGQDWARGGCAGAEPIWLLIEERADGQIQYAFSNLPVGTSRIQAVRLWKSRWPVEQGYQQMAGFRFSGRAACGNIGPWPDHCGSNTPARLIT